MRRPSLLDGAIRVGGDPLQDQHDNDNTGNYNNHTGPGPDLGPSPGTGTGTGPGPGPGPGHDRENSMDLSTNSGSAGGSAITRVTSNITTKPDGGVDDHHLHYHQKQYKRNQVSGRSTHNSSSTIVMSNRESDSDRALFFRHVDDDCNTPDYEVNLFFQLCEVTLQPISATSTESTRWANIRRWFLDHRNRAERYAACVQQGVFSTTPLHFICQHSDCPLDILNALISYGTETVSWEDTNGWLPLHYACAKHASFEILQALLNAYPDGELALDKRMRTPLHFVFYRSGNEDEHDSKILEDRDASRVVNLLRRASMVGDEKGRLPIHFAAAYGTSKEALEALIQSCPQSLHVKENTGRTPLHLVLANAHNNTSPQVLQCLLKHVKDGSINEVDDEGNLPLHLMSMRVEGMNGDTVHEKKSQENIRLCLKLYLDAKPTLSADFLTALQSLPGWLRDNAVTHSHVQNILNQRIAGRFPTFILLLDGYLYVLIIACFSHATKSHIDFRFGAKDLPQNINSTTGAAIFGATYFLIRETVKVASMISLNTLRSWFVRFESWLNIVVISLIYHYAGAMQRRKQELDTLSALGTPDFGSEEDLSFRSGVAFTLGALWLSVINFVKR